MIGFVLCPAIMQCVSSASVLRQHPQANFWSCTIHILVGVGVFVSIRRRACKIRMSRDCVIDAEAKVKCLRLSAAYDASCQC